MLDCVRKGVPLGPPEGNSPEDQSFSRKTGSTATDSRGSESHDFVTTKVGSARPLKGPAGGRHCPR